MKTATVHELKQELKTLSPPQLIDLCMRLAKYKKDNKELLTYLLYEAQDETSFIKSIKEEIDTAFEEMNTNTVYFAKKSLRKILRTITKFTRYSGIKETEIELLLYFCRKIRESGIPVYSNSVLTNLFENQIKKIHKAVSGLHEDLQYDYLQELNTLSDPE